MPIVIDISLYGKAVGLVYGQHSCGSPAVHHPSIDLVSSVGIPYGSEVGSVVISAVLVLLEFHLASGGAFEQPPVGLVLEFREICYSILYICVFAVTADGGSHHRFIPYPDFITKPVAVGFLSSGVISIVADMEAL